MVNIMEKPEKHRDKKYTRLIFGIVCVPMMLLGFYMKDPTIWSYFLGSLITLLVITE